MEYMTVERIITVSVLCLWFLFPIGVLVSFIRQDREQRVPKVVEPITAHERAVDSIYYASENVDDEDDIDEAVIPAYQIPKGQHGTNQHTNA